MIDADHHTVDDRRRELLDRIVSAGFGPFGANEPAVLLIPKRHVETWIQALLGGVVTEEQDCKSRKKPTSEDFRQAAQELYEWSRLNSSPGSTCVSSLERAMAEWRRIG
jgi:hypothetical protein